MRIFARKTEAVRVEFDEAQAFVEEHHRQGAVSQRNVTSVGLRFGGELVAVAQFCYPRTEAMRRKYTTELLRMAFRSDVRVVGGASKLVEFYKREYRPTDIFTYQDATGELTDVYEKAGFTLVSQAKKKQYLVAPGKTLETASRKEALGMAYATRYGPDRILGTKLGEVLREDGSRKTNAEIFIEDLGWHVEETAGDRIYEWFNPDITFYTYRITATDSDKYYYGVSHAKKANATVEDCLNDGYFGSGAPSEVNKFQNWRAKHAKTLSKEVLATFDAKAPAFEHERELVGDSWRDDPKCLNSCAGGRRGAPRREYGKLATLKECSIHGLTLHRKRYCVKCVAAKVYSTKVCQVHGEGTFVGDSCKRCVIEATWSLKMCPITG